MNQYKSFVLSIILMIVLSLQSSAQLYNEYLMLKGSVGSAPITMHLYKNNHLYQGYYYYDRLQRPVEISGIDSFRNGNLTLFANYQGKKEQFIINRVDKKFSGSMEIVGSGKINPLRLGMGNAPLKMAYYSVTDSLKLLDLPENYPLGQVSISSPWPDIKLEEWDWLKEDIMQLLIGVNNSSGKPDSLLKKAVADELKKYQLDYLNVSEKELKSSYKTFSYYKQKNLRIIYHTHKFISFAFQEYSFTGGAHGNSTYQFFTVDKLSKKKISINQLFNRTALEDLLPVLEKRYLIEKGLPLSTKLAEAGLFENKISKNPSSCYVTDKGIGFIYNPYTIGPYSSGMIHIFVPYHELTPLINKSFAKSMNWL